MSMSLPPLRRLLGIGSLALACLLAGPASAGVPRPPQDADDLEALAADDPMAVIQLSEQIIQSLGPDLKKLGESVLNLALPSGEARKIFEERVRVTDVVKPANKDGGRTLMEGAVRSVPWQVAERSQLLNRKRMAIWSELLGSVHFFEHAKFTIVRGYPLKSRKEGFEADVKFEGLARTASDGYVFARAHLRIGWGSARGAERAVGLIREWETQDLECTTADALLFEEVLDASLPSEALRQRARRSIHEELIVKLFHHETEPPPWFTAASWDRHPGLSVVDVDRDGLDDLYLMPRWGKNMLLHNRGDGTFDEIAEKLGLDLEDHCSAAIFADFDNDGDADAIIGRTQAPSRYLVQEEGRFVDRSDWVKGDLPYLVSSVSAVDYDRDGLLDVYLSTYAAAMIQGELNVSTVGRGSSTSFARVKGRLLPDFLSEEDSRELFSIYESRGHPIIDRPGPPNVLLHNEGRGRFSVVAGDHPLRSWRNTYQSTWADVDGDGDADLYVANDFAPNSLYRNDGGGKFVDVTEETGTSDIGVGMGVTFGDYDNDGRQDLYVSNMFTKAGQRITAQVRDLDPRITLMTRGNSLFRNRAVGFERVSGLVPPALLVEAAGWAWGAQFVDLDNDGLLDLFAPNGYYTAPEKIAIPVDT